MALTYEEKEAVWGMINSFYPGFNPFANQFSVDDVNDEVARITFEMNIAFTDCAKMAAPLELLSILLSVADLSRKAHAVSAALALLGFWNEPGSLALEGCRNTQAGARKTDLYMAFLEL